MPGGKSAEGEAGAMFVCACAKGATANKTAARSKTWACAAIKFQDDFRHP
jgi:hypothetical protein